MHYIFSGRRDAGIAAAFSELEVSSCGHGKTKLRA